MATPAPTGSAALCTALRFQRLSTCATAVLSALLIFFWALAGLLHRRASYRLPLGSIISYTVASPLVGAAQGAIDAFIARLSGLSGPSRNAESVALQLRLAEAIRCFAHRSSLALGRS